MSKSSIRIGVVEDNLLDVDLLQLMFAEPPEILFELHHSSRLKEALALLETQTLDVMLLDLGLPDCQGLEGFHRIKSYAPNLPIIIFSGQDDKDIALRAVAEGAQDYLVKGQTNAYTLKRAILHAIERQRATHEKLVRATFSSAANGIVTTKPDGEFILTNPAYSRMVGYGEAELRTLNLYNLIHPDDRARSLELTGQLLAGKIDNFGVEERYVRKDGGIVWVRANVSLERSADGRPVSIITVSEDITKRKRTEDALREREEQLRLYAEHSPAAIAMVDRDMKYLVVSSRWMEAYRLGDKAIIGQSHYEVFPEIPHAWREIHQRCLAGAIEKSEEDSFIRDDGSTYWIRWEVRPWHRADGSIGGLILFSEDISERKAAEERIEHLAFYDNLTGLANRLLLIDRLQLALATSVRNQKPGALLFIDLDNFKILNDTLGHDMGDLLLQQVAHRLVNCVRESDTVARLGGDEFVVMLEGMSEVSHEAARQAKIVGEKILASFNQPFQLAGLEHYSSPSIGVALFNDQSHTVEELLKRADIAMYQAKASGRNVMRFFDPEMQAVISARVALEADLHEALQQSQFLLHYQPQINRTGQIIGAEALVRWQHPKLGLVPPAKFISSAEDTGLILLLGHWVLETACIQLVIWAAKRETVGLTISVNVSARQFRQPDFVEQVLAVIGYTGANPKRLKLELTESLLADNTEDIIAKMIALKASGVGFSLDDFGIGYSSLAYLKRLPLDQLKIDQSFVRDVLTDPNDATIARTIIALGQSLGMTVVAEGVETKDQHDFLAKEGCNVYQGYYFSRPVPIEQFEEYRLTIKNTSQKKKAKTGK